MTTTVFAINVIIIIIFAIVQALCNYALIINASSTRQKRHAIKQINNNIFYITLYAMVSTGIIILFY